VACRFSPSEGHSSPGSEGRLLPWHVAPSFLTEFFPLRSFSADDFRLARGVQIFPPWRSEAIDTPEVCFASGDQVFFN